MIPLIQGNASQNMLRAEAEPWTPIPIEQLVWIRGKPKKMQ